MRTLENPCPFCERDGVCDACAQVIERSPLPCTYCNGEGLCWDGSDPLGDCGDEPHRCHACGGSGDIEDQVIF